MYYEFSFDLNFCLCKLKKLLKKILIEGRLRLSSPLICQHPAEIVMNCWIRFLPIKVRPGEGLGRTMGQKHKKVNETALERNHSRYDRERHISIFNTMAKSSSKSKGGVLWTRQTPLHSKRSFQFITSEELATLKPPTQLSERATKIFKKHVPTIVRKGQTSETNFKPPSEDIIAQLFLSTKF